MSFLILAHVAIGGNHAVSADKAIEKRRYIH